MTQRVLLFASAREVAKASEIVVELPDRATVRELKSALVKACPAIERLIGHMAIAINNDYADDLALVPAGAEVAAIPPVSGGEGNP